ncbi:carbohydrate-binding module family 1 protein [Tulasnella calospora MUT 4182]|uniref:Carbohydrate-binding module family 1 protein n=1 Tax=Tulasnella calospora MUT 4182 TaxID=1051891 RepID=A0A0C3QFK5_9AGAM|nr:carbohydrate-binding module family 1 protein [Tulasnella calospora MUT 4182]
MYKFAVLIAVAASVFSLVCATVPLYGQCGGSGFTGETVCTLPATCVYLNYWYSQCLNLASTTTTPSTTTKTTVTGVITDKPTTTTTPTKTITTSSTVTCYTDLPVFSAPPVRANTNNIAVTGLYLHRRSDGKAVLNKNIAGIPLWWTAPGTIALLEPTGMVDGKICQAKDYLNVLSDSASPSASYKPLAFSLGAPISDYWSSVRLSVTAASPWGAQSWFLACPTSVTDEYLVYLQTGTDVPPGQTCALTQLS